MRIFIKRGSTHIVVLEDEDADIKKYENNEEYHELFMGMI